MTDQEAFTKIATHLLTQRRKARENGRCKIHTADGRQCALGCLIPDKRYGEDLEERDAEELCGMLPDIFGGIDLCLLDDLMNIHDRHPVADWRLDLEALAKDRGLVMPNLWEGS